MTDAKVDLAAKANDIVHKTAKRQGHNQALTTKVFPDLESPSAPP